MSNSINIIIIVISNILITITLNDIIIINIICFILVLMIIVDVNKKISFILTLYKHFTKQYRMIPFFHIFF